MSLPPRMRAVVFERTGMFGVDTVPTPRLTKIRVFSRRPDPAITGNSRAATAPIPGSTI